jgi:hypothetical protein
VPKYRCHKIVRAFRIGAVKLNFDGHYEIWPADPAFPNFHPPVDWEIHWLKRENRDDLGYYVLHNDFYSSWSPTKAFEDKDDEP